MATISKPKLILSGTTETITSLRYISLISENTLFIFSKTPLFAVSSYAVLGYR